LSRHVSHFYIGLLLSSTFAPSHRLVLLTGSRRDGEIGIGSQSDFETPIPQAIRHYPPLLNSEIEEVARLAAALETVAADTSRSHWRFFRALSLYVETRSLRDNMERLHQYCRCIEGLIMAEPGKALKQFKSRTELFIHWFIIPLLSLTRRSQLRPRCRKRLARVQDLQRLTG
jgi:hypothetical protein